MDGYLGVTIGVHFLALQNLFLAHISLFYVRNPELFNAIRKILVCSEYALMCDINCQVICNKPIFWRNLNYS